MSLPTPTPAPTLQVSSSLLASETPIESLAVLTDLLNASVEIFPTPTTSIEEAVPSLPSTTTIALLTPTPAPSLLILASLSLSEASSGPPDILSTSVVEIFPTPTISMEEASSSERIGFAQSLEYADARSVPNMILARETRLNKCYKQRCVSGHCPCLPISLC